MLDIKTFRRRIGLFRQRSINYKRINEVFTNAQLTTKKNCLPNNATILKSIIRWKVSLVLLVMTTTILWTTQDTRSSKTRQRSKSFSNFIYKITKEKILFNQIRSSESKLVRARSHLNYFTKCLEKNVYPKNLYIKSEHFNIAFATNDIKESLCQLDQKTITEKMSLCITHFKLKVIELEEEIAIHKDKLRNICDGERLTFLQNKLKQFKDKLYKELEKKKHKKFNKLSPSLSEIWNTPSQ